MAVSMSKAVVGSIVSLIAYIISFTPFMAIFVLETSYHAGLRIALVSIFFLFPFTIIYIIQDITLYKIFLFCDLTIFFRTESVDDNLFQFCIQLHYKVRAAEYWLTMGQCMY